MILRLLTLAGLGFGLDIPLLPSHFAFQSDGSNTEGRGVVTHSLGPESTGQTAPVHDYSISFWYQNLFSGFGNSLDLYSIACNSLYALI